MSATSPCHSGVDCRLHRLRSLRIAHLARRVPVRDCGFPVGVYLQIRWQDSLRHGACGKVKRLLQPRCYITHLGDGTPANEEHADYDASHPGPSWQSRGRFTRSSLDRFVRGRLYVLPVLFCPTKPPSHPSPKTSKMKTMLCKLSRPPKANVIVKLNRPARMPMKRPSI